MITYIQKRARNIQSLLGLTYPILCFWHLILQNLPCCYIMLENDIALLNKLFQSQNIFLKINLPDLFILLSSNFNICFLPFYSFNRKYVTAQESPTRPHMRGEIQPHHLTMPLDFNTNRPSLRMLNHGANILHRLEVTCIY